ncbi:MAG: C4-type zinc ribbon domain-containing protein [Chitinispirillales bacterium]|jgi:predicted  nucleic acid-binding Zn-ribbon protein|nr:C4-type zinc ribbon domain-containing protein [Chitinispirillales bacterium]
MIQDLEYLIKLQDIDLRIKEQELAKEQHPAAVSSLAKQIALAEAANAAAEERLSQLMGGIKGIDDQTAALRESLDKSQERLGSIQTNREYDAVHKEIEAQKAMLAATESKKSDLEANIERHKAEYEEAQKSFENIKAELQPQIDGLEAKIGAIDSVIAEITTEREKVSPSVSLQTMRTYDAIRKKRKNGKAISLVGGNKTCSVCFMVLQPQLCSEIRRGTKIILCESCGSMLIWDEANSGA